MAGATPKGIDLGIPVWGRKYCNRLLAQALPSLFAPGNLPALARRLPTRVILHTNAEDAAFLRPRIPRAYQEIVTFHCEENGANVAEMAARLDPAGAGSGQIMKACHNLSLQRAYEEDRGWLCGWTDTIWSDGFGERVLRTIDSGRRAMLHTATDAAASIMPALRQYADLDKGTLAVPPRTLATLAMRAHAATEPASIDRVRGPGAGLFWPLAKRAIQVRMPHVVVGYIHQERLAQCEGSADDDLADRGLTSLDQVDFVEDSDEYCICGIDEPGATRNAGIYRPNVEPRQLAVWLRKYARPWHFEYLKQRFWCHDGSVTPDERAALNDATDRFVDEALRISAEAGIENEADDLILAPPRVIETLQGVGLVAFAGKVFTVPMTGGDVAQTLSSGARGVAAHATLDAARDYVLAGKAGR